MLMLEAVGAALLISLLTGGSLARMADEPLRGEGLLLLLLPLQLAWPGLARALGLSHLAGVVVWLWLMAILATILFLNSVHSTILAVAGLGIALNVLVIGLNGGMPVSLRASSELGITRAEAVEALEGDCLHKPLLDDSRLPFLADIIAVPGPRWHRGIVSLGDFLLVLGLGGWVYSASRPRAVQAHSSGVG